jgi:hypothetical protein
VQIVENVRNGDKVSQKILRYVGIALDEEEELKLRSLANEYIIKMKLSAQENSKQISMIPFTESEIRKSVESKKLGRPAKKSISDIIPTNQVTLDDICEEKRIIEGVHEIGGKLYDDLGYNKLLDNKHYSKILKDIVLSRLISPCSKHKTHRALYEQFDIHHSLDQIYRMMDHVHDKINNIKTLTYQNTLSLCPEGCDIILFDVTTLYFESIETDDLREFGYSKDCRFNTTQLVLALATNGDGLPIAYELFEGNKAEVGTLIDSIDRWRLCFAIKDVCFVGDRAMFSKKNLDQINMRGYKYVISTPLRKLSSNLKTQILDDNNYTIKSFDQDIVWLGEFKYDEQKSGIDEEYHPHTKRLIVTYSSKRAKKDKADRQRILDKIKKNMGGKASGDTKKLLNNSGVKKYTTTANSITTISDDKIEAASLMDGMHGIITNIKNDSPQWSNSLELLARYRRLWVIEESFRINKHNLKMRPIYHYKPERIKSHIAICYIAFALIRQIEYRAKLTQKVTITEIMEGLMSVQASIYKHKITGDRYRMPSSMSLVARKIYKTFNLERKIDAEIYLR